MGLGWRRVAGGDGGEQGTNAVLQGRGRVAVGVRAEGWRSETLHLLGVTSGSSPSRLSRRTSLLDETSGLGPKNG